MTHYAALAREAKREKDFTQAHTYYKQEMKSEGISTGLLRGIAKTYYLQGEHYLSVVFHLAATHLALHDFLRAFEKGDIALQQAVNQVPEEVQKMFPHPVGALLLYDNETMKHIGHAGIDHDKTYEKSPYFKMYANIYYAKLLDNGSLEHQLNEHGLTEEDLKTLEKTHYEPIGLNMILDDLKWNELHNPNVFFLYVVDQM